MSLLPAFHYLSNGVSIGQYRLCDNLRSTCLECLGVGRAVGGLRTRHRRSLQLAARLEPIAG